MFLIIGLGNFGREYENTRHNVGFSFIDHFLKSNSFNGPSNKFDAETHKGEFAKQSLILAKPLTYMNNSGKSASQIVKFYKIDLNKIIVIYDDLDLATGKIKVKIGGGSAGHNGIKSLDSHIGKEYIKIRIGISRPEFGDTANYVLGKFSKNDQEAIQESFCAIEKNFPLLLEGKIEDFASKVNQ